MFSNLLSLKKASVPGPEPARNVNLVQENPILAILKVLVDRLNDPSVEVGEASARALKNNAPRHAELIIDCCIMAVKPATKRGDSGPLPVLAMQVMAHAVKVANENVLEAALMRDIVHVALTGLAAARALGSPEQSAASDVLVAVGTRMPDVMFDDVMVQLRKGAVPMLFVATMFAEFAEADAARFVPRVKAVFARIIPALGGIRDQQRIAYAQALTAWCGAITHYQHDIHPEWKMDAETRAFIFSAFELLQYYWLRANEPQVRGATVEALGEMCALIGRKELKKSIHKLLNALLSLYSNHEDDPLPVSRAIHSVLAAALSEADSPRLLDYQAVVYTLTTLLPMAAARGGSSPHVSATLKNTHEVLRSFDVVAQAFPEEVCGFLLQRLDNRDEMIKLGALELVRHLLPRLTDKWQNKKTGLREKLGGLLKELSLEVRKALAQVVLVVAASNYLDVDNAEPFMEFLVRQCSSEAVSESSTSGKMAPPATPSLELRTICEKGLFLLASTAVNAEPYLWPYLLKTLTPPQYTPAAATVCRCIAEIARRRTDVIARDLAVLGGSFPTPQALLARLVVLLESPLERGRLGERVLKVLYGLAPFFHKNVVLLWRDEVPKLTAFLEQGGEEDWWQEQWEEMVLDLLGESLEVIADQGWTLLLGSAFEDQFRLYAPSGTRHPFCYRCIGVVLQKLSDSSYCYHKLEQLYARADLSQPLHRKSVAMAVGLAANSHLETVLELLRKVFAQQKRKLRPFLGFLGFSSASKPEVERHFASLALMYGYTAFYAPPTELQGRIDALVGTGYFAELLKVDTWAAKYAVIAAIDLLARSVQGAADRGVPFPLKKKEDLLTHVMMLMAGSGWASELLEIQSRALEAFTTLISVDPPVSPIARNRLLESVIHLFAAPPEPTRVITPLLSSLVTLLITMLRAAARDPSAQAELLELQLSQLDRFVTSADDVIRERACGAVLSLLQEYRALLSAGSSRSEGAEGSGTGGCRSILLLGERLAVYLPRCTDPLVHVRELAGTIVEELASIASLLPEPPGRPGTDSTHASSSSVQSTSASASRGVESGSRDAALDAPEAVTSGPEAATSGSGEGNGSTDGLERTRSSVGHLVKTFEEGSSDGRKSGPQENSWGSIGGKRAEGEVEGAGSREEAGGESRRNVAVEERPVGTSSSSTGAGGFQPGVGVSTREQSWMKIRDLKGGLASQKDQYKVVGDIVRALCADLSHTEVVCFLVSMRMGETPEVALGAACGLEEMVRCRGGQISPQSAPLIVKNLLAAAGAASGPAKEEVLGALSEMAKGGHAAVVYRVALEAANDQEEEPKPSMYDRMLRRVSQEERHSLDLLEEVFQALADQPGLALELCDALLALIRPPMPGGAAKGPDGEKKEAAGHSSDFNISDAATWALGVVLRPGTPIAAVCTNERYPQTVATLLLRIAPVRRTPLNPVLAHDYVTTFQAFCAATSDQKMAAAVSSNGPEFIARSDRWTDLIDEIVVCIAGSRRSRIAHVCKELWPALGCERVEERAIAAAALSGFVVHVAENEELLSQLVERLIGHVNDEERTVRKFCVRGLTQVPSIAMAQYAPGVLSSVIPLLDDTSEDVIFTVLCGLEPLLTEASPDAVHPHLLTLAEKLLHLQTRQHTPVRAAAFATFGFIVRFKEGASTPEFADYIHQGLPRVVFHIEDPAATVRSACRKTLETLAPSFPGVDFSPLIAGSSSSGGNVRNPPLQGIAAQLSEHYDERLSLYIDVTLSEIKSVWPAVRSSAALFAACLVVEARGNKVQKVQVDQVVSGLVRLGVDDPSAEVRLTVASALSVVLGTLADE
ncbi:ARM repeat superfamily protein [Klebsormidium nitens]|uniref:ARM repeat superfamily protein n=1 Tax=Klebsormidium nitens TaxID=105231 RepID=A0A1Y1HJI9_KLENI|nr:ARM repeat superfamily protein [Klebsormidium nitens]|eukprot:GAQ77702.1 ARM repeat superfamily protein [Klebsormidium nitens]